MFIAQPHLQGRGYVCKSKMRNEKERDEETETNKKGERETKGDDKKIWTRERGERDRG